MTDHATTPVPSATAAAVTSSTYDPTLDTLALDDVTTDASTADIAAPATGDGRARLTFYMRPDSNQGGRWMAAEFILKADGSGPEEVILRGRTNPKSEMAEDVYAWSPTRAVQVATWITKKHEAGYTNFGGPVESFTPLDYTAVRSAWNASCGETDPDVLGMMSQFLGESDGKVVADRILSCGFTIDFTTSLFGQRVKGAESYVRPNGDTYYARELGGMTDVMFLRQARATGMSAMFNSPPGVGKTALVEAAFPDCISIDGTGETEVSDFIGQFVPHETEAGRYDWVDGPLTLAASRGVPLFVDELSRINPQVLTIIYPLMDGRGRFHAPGRPASIGGSDVVAQPGFYICAAYNPDIPGCRIDEPLMSRFALHIGMTTCYVTAKILGVPDEAVKCADAINQARMDPAIDLDWAPQLRELIRFKATADAFSTDVAWQALVGAAPVHARPAISEYVRTYAKAHVAVLGVGPTVEAKS